MPLTGEKAIQHLKDSGQYESLAAAITGARYGAKTADNAKAFAQNPAHGIQSTFTPEGLTLTIRSAGFGQSGSDRAVSPVSNRPTSETPQASEYTVARQAGSSTTQQAGSLRYKAQTETTHTVAWRLESLGYGEAQIPVPPGELKVTGQRVELIRSGSTTCSIYALGVGKGIVPSSPGLRGTSYPGL